MTFFILLFRFALYGLLCFGGGYMLVPLLFADLVSTRNVLTAAEFGNLVSIAQLTPGPVGINVATYTGCLEGGVWGSVAATCGLVLPTLFLSTFAVMELKKHRDGFVVKGILTGVRPAALGMIFFAALLFLRLSVFPEGIAWKSVFAGDVSGISVDWTALAIFALVFVALSKTKIPALALILTGAALGGAAAFL